MKLALTICLFVLLFMAAFRYCFRNRRLSTRRWSFHLLVASVGCGAAVAAIALVDVARVVRGLAAHEITISNDLSRNLDPDGIAGPTADVPQLRFAKPGERTAESWIAWQNRLRKFLADEVYELDFSASAGAEASHWLRGEIEDDTLTRREFTLVAPDGDLIPAVLLLPTESEAPLPAIVFVPGHVRDGESGLRQLVLPIRSYQNAAARELAKSGFVTLTIELRGFGFRGAPEFPDHFAVAYNAVLAGSFYKKVVLGDLKRAVDFLVSLPEVDPDQIGISGVSLGGELAVEYAALDNRIRAVSFHAHGGSTGRHPQSVLRADRLHYCHVVPGSGTTFEIEDPFLMLAPRPLQGIRAKQEALDPEFVAALTDLWSLLGEPHALDLLAQPDARESHVYFVGPAVHFFRQNLRPVPQKLAGSGNRRVPETTPQSGKASASESPSVSNQLSPSSSSDARSSPSATATRN